MAAGLFASLIAIVSELVIAFRYDTRFDIHDFHSYPPCPKPGYPNTIHRSMLRFLAETLEDDASSHQTPSA